MTNKKCKHINRENFHSNKGNDYNMIEVKCLDCGYHRHETRYTSSNRVDSSKWFKPNK